ncbi:MAG TPA: hypothetical protein VHX37_10280 [Acidobacteriaceae bacterium]|jgi:hypothetical protein|nr:hypothetical protein [Acidobacteriaceae bacterium]
MMAKVTLLFAILLVALGAVGWLGSGREHPTALIPMWFGLALGIFGILAISPSEGRRKVFMHVNVTIGLLGFLGGLIEGIRGWGKPVMAGAAHYLISAETAKLWMAALMLIYVLLCVRSFISARSKPAVSA